MGGTCLFSVPPPTGRTLTVLSPPFPRCLRQPFANSRLAPSVRTLYYTNLRDIIGSTRVISLHCRRERGN